MYDETGDLTGFQPDHINLIEMNEAIVKTVFIGDGMSGKTQILITLGKLLINYLQQISLGSTKTYHTEFSNVETDSYSFTPAFHNWVTNHGFFLRYGKTDWDFSAVNLDSETIGLEDFEFIFPYVHNNQTYKIKLIGNDVGGQNIFDHFRAVLGKMTGPDDNLIVVFDKSRELSCFNSIEQINKVIGGMTSETRGYFRPDSSRITYCGNKKDLEEHIKDKKWQEGVINSFMNKITKILADNIGDYSLPSLVDEKEEERIVSFKIENNRITFPDLESLVYNSIRESDEKFRTNIMSEVNTKALGREIAAQLFYDRKIGEQRNQSLQLQEIWENFKSLLFKSRPLAMQYSAGIKVLQQTEDSAYFGKIRNKWHKFGLLTPISHENIEAALHQSSNARVLLAEMGKCFDTNALSGEGILPLIDSIIQETLTRKVDPSQRQRKRTIIRKFEKF
ncbi:MAG: hypothetical protein ACXADY_11105 [Candidatus Hodarchaeales archaeon]